MLQSTQRFFKAIGILFNFPTTGLVSVTSFSQMMFFSSSRQIILSSNLSLIYLIASVGYQVWKLIYPSLVLSTQQEFLKPKLIDTSISGIRSTTSLDKYLGFSILKGRAKRSDFLFIIEKMQTRLASWKNRLLNKPGRLTLASSVLSSIPSYYMQIVWLPQNICDSIDQTTRNFIWR